MYCPEQLSNASGGPGFSSSHGKSIEALLKDLNDGDALQRAKSRIIAQASARFEQARESCKTDLLNRNLRGAINRVIEMYRLDEYLLIALSRVSREPSENFDAWRLLKRSDIELLLRAAENVGDKQASLLGERLLREVVGTEHSRCVAT